MAKSRDDFTDSELKKIHAELEAEPTVAARGAVYKKHGANRQAFAQWFRSVRLPKLSEARAEGAGSGEPKKRGRKPGSTALKIGTNAKRKPGRPPGSRNASSANTSSPNLSPAKASSNGSGGSLSVEEKEILIRLLAKFLDD